MSISSGPTPVSSSRAPAGDEPDLAGEPRAVGHAGDLLIGAGRRLVQAEVTGLVGHGARQEIDTFGPGD